MGTPLNNYLLVYAVIEATEVHHLKRNNCTITVYEIEPADKRTDKEIVKS